MGRTKENNTYHKILYRFTQYILIVLFLFSILTPGTLHYADAANITVHNYVTNDTFHYSRDQVRYRVNDTLLTTAPPGLILSNGAAVGPFQAVFQEALGVESDYVDGKSSFTVSYGPHTIKMTLGTTEVTVNGEKKFMNNAPFIYSFEDSPEKYLYVPTRFMAESLGFDYIWDDTISTVSIKRANIIYDGKQALRYTGSIPTFLLNGRPVTNNIFTGYILDDTVFFPAEEYFKATGMASFAYAEGSGLIILKNGERTVRMVLDSPIAYVDNTAYLLESVPRLITPQTSSKASIYIPAEFVAKALGYTVFYQKSSGVFEVTGTLQAPVTRPIKPSGTSDTSLPDTASYGTVLFSYQAHDQIVRYFTGLGYYVPSLISAYSCMNSDALYLKGIQSNQIKITDKADVIEIEIDGCYNPYNKKVTYNPNASFLSYFNLSGTDSIKIIIIKSKDLHYYTYSVSNGSVIHFTDAGGMYQDYLTFFGNNETVPDNTSDHTDIFSGIDISSYLPKAIFTRNHFVIPLPEGINAASVTDSDEYSKKRFTISIPGNYMAFLTEQDTYNPVKTLQSVQFSYKVSTNTTVITFNTTKIQGYSYTVADGFLAVKIADPKDIYDKIIVLDAGHGGIDPGTLRGSVYEKAVNYNVINVYAPEYFNDSDIKVYYTRTTDTKIALQTRAEFAATVGADLFISFHVNAHSNSAVNGTSVYYSNSNNAPSATGLKSSVLATSVVNHLSSSWGTSNKGILADRFVVIHNNTVPAVLVECGFITNNKDFEKIKDPAYQKKAAKALFDAVSEIFDKYPTNR